MRASDGYVSHNSAGAKFGATFGGCWHNNKVYAVDADKQLCAFDVASRAWSRCGIKVPSNSEWVNVRLLSNPHDKWHLFVMVWPGGLHRIDLITREVSLVTTPPVPFDMTRDVLLVGRDASTFVVFAALQEGVWHVFNSSTNAWTKLGGWKASKGEYNHNYLVHAVSLGMLFYHVHETDTWEAVPLP